MLFRSLGSEPGLVLHYPMGVYAANGSDAKGLVLVDQSPSAITATLSGGVRWVASRAPVDRPATPLNVGLATVSDTGQSSTDRITNQTQVTVTGTGSPGSVITVAVDGVTSPYQGTVAPDGTFSVVAPASAGVRQVTAQAIGTTGLSSMKSATATFTVKTTGARVSSISRNPLVAGTPPSFTVTFDEAVWGVTNASFMPTAGAGILGTPTIQSVTGSGTTYVVALGVSGVSGNSVTLGVQLGATGATDVAGNAPAGLVPGVVPESFVVRQRQVVTDTSWQSPNGAVAAYASQVYWGNLLPQYPAGTTIIWAGADCTYCDRTFTKVLPNTGLITSLGITLTLDDYHWVYINDVDTDTSGTIWNRIYQHDLTSNAYLGGPGTTLRVDGYNFGGPAGFMASLAVASVEVP